MRQKTSLVGLATILMLLAIPAVYAATSGSLGAVLSVGNAAPSVDLVTCGDVSPADGTAQVVMCYINVSDDNGINDLLLDGVNGSFKNATGHIIAHDSCVNSVNFTAENTATFNCTFTFQYYIEAGNQWNATFNASDGTNTVAQNAVPENITVGTCTALQIASPQNNITFGSLTAGTDDNEATNDPVIMNNTCNTYFTEINVSANNLTGHDTDTEHIYATNFTVNDADAAGGEALGEENADATQVASTSIPVGPPSEGQDSVYVYVDISAGLAAQEYSATKTGREWVWGVVG